MTEDPYDLITRHHRHLRKSSQGHCLQGFPHRSPGFDGDRLLICRHETSYAEELAQPRVVGVVSLNDPYLGHARNSTRFVWEQSSMCVDEDRSLGGPTSEAVAPRSTSLPPSERATARTSATKLRRVLVKRPPGVGKLRSKPNHRGPGDGRREVMTGSTHFVAQWPPDRAPTPLAHGRGTGARVVQQVEPATVGCVAQSPLRGTTAVGRQAQDVEDAVEVGAPQRRVPHQERRPGRDGR